VAFFRDLKNILVTGSRHPGTQGPGELAADKADAAALAASQPDLKGGPSNTAGPDYPPGYVKDYDEGRPSYRK
jgi:hypothetical protein